MRKILRAWNFVFSFALITLALFISAIILAVSQFAGAVEFKFKFPTIPSTPKIVSVTNSSASLANPDFKVSANIQGQFQREICCMGVCTHECEPNCDFSACGMTDFTGAIDPRIVPNPTCIPGSVDSSGGANAAACTKSIDNPLVYWYYNGAGTATPVKMTYSATTGNFTAPIPIAGLSDGDVVTYFIVAADNRGNVVSQVPDPDVAPCSLSGAWDAGYDTPAINNVALMNSYEQCGKFKSGAPTLSYNSDYTMNDPYGDTCGETGELLQRPRVDILGVSAGVGKGVAGLEGQNVVCAKIKLAATPPGVIDSESPIDSYMMVFFNPDIVDPNPYDTHMVNATAISYSPIGCGEGGTSQVKVLWDGDCVSDPNTADPLRCKLISGGSSENRLKIITGTNQLMVVAQDSLPNGKTIVGGPSKEVSAMILTGDIRLDGGTPFWLTDMTAGLSVVQKNQSVYLGGCLPSSPGPPSVGATQTCVNGAGSAVNTIPGTCNQSGAPGTTPPTSNKCRLIMNPSLDATSQYKIYRNTTANASTATFLTTVTSSSSAAVTYDDTITYASTDSLKGQKYYYFFSSVYNGVTTMETLQSKWAKSVCTVEDWVPPTPPSGLTCLTPAGKTGKCKCDWTMDTNADTSIRGFRVTRDGFQVADESILIAAQGLTDYSFTDPSSSGETLSLRTPYIYGVKAVDAGGNVSSAVTTTCVPQDHEAPAKVESLGISLAQTDPKSMDFDWNGSDEADVNGYNIYKCYAGTSGSGMNSNCDTFPSANWTAVNVSLIAHNGAGVIHTATEPDVEDHGSGLDLEEWYCFWIEACDKCDTENPATCDVGPNCSNFSPLPMYRKCMYIASTCIGELKPSTPTNVAGASLPEGGKCLLTWTKVTTHSTGVPFEDPSNPRPVELSGYYILRAPQGETVPDNPHTAPAQNIAGKAIVSSSPSFTDTNLANGTTYQYYVIAVDSEGTFSPSQSSVATCTPADTKAPDTVSGVTAEYVEADAACKVKWSAVVDQDAVAYTVHRCDKAAASCATVADFPAANNLAPVPSAPLEISDASVNITATPRYTYCVTAADSKPNLTAILSGMANASLASNCKVCTNIAPLGSEPPTGVSAAPYTSNGTNSGVKVTYTNSPSYAANGSAGGHNIYLCATSSAASCSKKLNGALETASHSTTPYSIENLIINNTVAPGTYWFAVSYQNIDLVESTKVISSASVTIAPQPMPTDPCPVVAPPAGCSIIVKVGKITEKKIVACLSATDAACKNNKYKIVDAAISGAVVNVVDRTTGAIVRTIIPTAAGAVADIKIDPSLSIWYSSNPGHEYRVEIIIPFASYAGPYGLCSNPGAATGEACRINLTARTVDAAAGLVLSGPGTTVVAGRSVPKIRPVGTETAADFVVGGGGEIGNPKVDTDPLKNKVDIWDLAEIKPLFGLTPDKYCYRAWADFDQSGKVDVWDLSVLKSYFGKKIPVNTAEGAPAPALSSEADPLPTCCKTKSTPCP